MLLKYAEFQQVNESIQSFDYYLSLAKRGLLTAALLATLSGCGIFSRHQISQLEETTKHSVKKEEEKKVDGIEKKTSGAKYYNGIDISKYQIVTDWNALNKEQDFIICKATEGINITDSKFHEYWNHITTIKGAYHFFHPNYSGIAQAKHYLKVAKLKKGDFRPIIDVELVGAWRNRRHLSRNINNLNNMITYIKRVTGNNPVIYTTENFHATYLKNANLHGCDIWYARYGAKLSHKEWNMWQFSEKSRVKGIKGKVDKNVAKDINKLRKK
jgi:lysozyme